MPGVIEATERAQPVREGLGVRRQAALREVRDRGVIEGAHGFDDCIFWVFQVFIGHDRDDERLLVLRPAPGLATIAFATQIRVVDLHQAIELPGFLAHCHRLHHFVLEPPRAAVGHAQVTLEFERGHVRLGRCQQVHG